MPIITEAFRKKLTLKINLVKKKNKLLYPGRDFVHIQDLLNIILKIIKNNTRGTAILNVGRGKLTYLDEIIKIFEKYVNKFSIDKYNLSCKKRCLLTISCIIIIINYFLIYFPRIKSNANYIYLQHNMNFKTNPHTGQLRAQLIS